MSFAASRTGFVSAPRTTDIKNRLDILYVTQRYDGLFNFACQKK